MKYLAIAVHLLTTLPIRTSQDWEAGDSGRAAGWYPLVGLMLGALVAGIFLLSTFFFSPLVTAALSLAIWVALTGGLHLDGLADCCDGLLHASSPERRLEIMKDSRLGTFGGLGLMLVLILKVSALASLSLDKAIPAVLFATSLGRWSILPAGLQPLARPDGMGADFVSGLRKSALLGGGLIPVGLAIYLGSQGIITLGLSLVTLYLVLRFVRARIGGVTGDVFGLIVEVIETLTLIIVSA